MVYLLGSLLALFADRKINGSESLTGERGNIHGGKIDRFTFIGNSVAGARNFSLSFLFIRILKFRSEQER